MTNVELFPSILHIAWKETRLLKLTCKLFVQIYHQRVSLPIKWWQQVKKSQQACIGASEKVKDIAIISKEKNLPKISFDKVHKKNFK